MIYLKTARLIGLSAEIGAIISNLSNEECKLMKSFGESLGMAYQVQDDIFELFSDSLSMNKSLDSDIILQKKTFLWASVSDLNDRKELSLIMKKYYTDKTKTIIKIRNFINRLG